MWTSFIGWLQCGQNEMRMASRYGNFHADDTWWGCSSQRAIGRSTIPPIPEPIGRLGVLTVGRQLLTTSSSFPKTAVTVNRRGEHVVSSASPAFFRQPSYRR